MCDATAVAGGAALLQAGSAIAGHSAQNAQSAAVAAAAKRDYRLRLSDIGTRQREEQDAASIQIQEAQRATALATGSTAAAAAEGGVGGNSVLALQNQLQGDLGNVTTGVLRNRDSILGQLQREKLAAQADAARTIAGAPPASPLATGISIAGAGLGFATTRIGSRPAGTYRVNRSGNTTQAQPSFTP